MKNTKPNRKHLFTPSEDESQQLLIDKMGLSPNELEEISKLYGVSAVRLLEIMSLSKYEFINSQKNPGQCMPCHYLPKARVVQIFRDIA